MEAFRNPLKSFVHVQTGEKSVYLASLLVFSWDSLYSGTILAEDPECTLHFG